MHVTRSGSHTLKTTIGIQLGLDASEESRAVMTLLSILGLVERFSGLRLG